MKEQEQPPKAKLGIDAGGTKTEFILLDEKDICLFKKRFPTPATYREWLTLVTSQVLAAEQNFKVSALVGISFPGAVHPQTGATFTHFTGGLPDRGPVFPARDLGALLNREIRIANDAVCFTLYEAQKGAGFGFRSVFGLILGTGVGGGLAVNGKPVPSLNGFCGEWGHLSLPQPGPADFPLRLCPCGRQGCIETYISGRAFDLAAGEAYHFSAAEVTEKMRTGDLRALALFDHFLTFLARSLTAPLYMIDPEIIVIGGGLSKIPELYKALPGILKPLMPEGFILPPIVPNCHGDSAGVFGAALLWDLPEEDPATEINAFIRYWFGCFDRLDPEDTFLPFLAEDVVLSFPEGQFTGHEGFKAWYDNIKSLISAPTEHKIGPVAYQQTAANRFLVTVSVDFKAPKKDKSGLLAALVSEEWELIRAPSSNRLIIQRYTVKLQENTKSTASGT